MSKETKRKLLILLIGVAILLVIAYAPAETASMSRAAWTYLGCFAFMLVIMIGRIVPEWASVFAIMALLVVFRVCSISEVAAQFSSSTLWLCIGVFIMSIGVNNCGITVRLALWILNKFPGNYKGQITAMMLSGLVTTPIIPSSTAKTAIMAPLIGQVCKVVNAEPKSKAALGLWLANFTGTSILGMGFISGSAFVAIMIGFIGESMAWGRWFLYACVWYITAAILTFLYCIKFCKPAESADTAGDMRLLKEQYEALGPFSLKEKQGVIILGCALLLWLTQSLHGIDAGVVTLLADVAFAMCGMILPAEVGSKGMWTTTLFVGGVLGVAGLMPALGVSSWIAEILGPVVSPILVSPFIFVPALCIMTYLLRYVIVSQSCCLAVMVAIFSPLIGQYGISLFVVVFVVMVSTCHWNAEYMNPLFVGYINLTGGAIEYSNAKRGSYAFCVINLIAMTLSVFLWRALGIC